MYQANVYSVSRREHTFRNFSTWEKAAGNLAYLMREAGHTDSQAALVALLARGEVEYRRYRYWVTEAA